MDFHCPIHGSHGDSAACSRCRGEITAEIQRLDIALESIAQDESYDVKVQELRKKADKLHLKVDKYDDRIRNNELKREKDRKNGTWGLVTVGCILIGFSLYCFYVVWKFVRGFF